MAQVSIITPCLNGARFLNECIESVLAQTSEQWEWIIVDDGSTDGSRRIVEELCRVEKRAKLLSTQGRQGAAVARNLGIQAAASRYIAFLDCDDAWLPTKLELQVGVMRANDLAFAWSSYFVVDEEGGHIRTQSAPTRCTYRDLLTKRAVIGCLTAIYDAHKYGRQLMPMIRMGQDYGLFLRLLRVGEAGGLKSAGIAQPLARYRVHSGAMTRNKLTKAWFQWKMYRDIERLSMVDSAYCFANYVVRGLVNRV